MSGHLTYKGYYGSVEYSNEDDCLYGRILGIRSLISYEGSSLAELKADFKNAVDEYLQDCEKRNIKPEQPYKGSFNVRISPELHRSIALYAYNHHKSLNSAVEEAIASYISVS